MGMFNFELPNSCLNQVTGSPLSSICLRLEQENYWKSFTYVKYETWAALCSVI